MERHRPASATAALVFSLILCPSGAAAESLIVAVAANMMPVMEVLKKDFRAQTGADLVLVSGSSGKFAAQIREGAPFDAFISADTEYPEQLAADGHADGAPVLYAYGNLVLWTLRDLDVAKGFALVDAASKIAVADPKVAPYGRAAVAALKAAGVYEVAGPKLVYGEAISQVNSFVTTKAADFGLTAKSVVLAPKTKGLGRWADVDPKLYEPIAQSFIILQKGAKNNPGLCRRFTAFMAGPEARAALTRLGYRLPAASPADI